MVKSPSHPKRIISTSTAWVVLLTALPSFFLGSLVCTFSCINQSSPTETPNSALERALKEPSNKLAINAEQEGQPAELSILGSGRNNRFLTGLTRVDKEELTKIMDLGVPIDNPKEGALDIIVLYNQYSLPDNPLVEQMSPQDALENCDFLNLVLTDYTNRKQCIGLVPQYESYHIQKWMKQDDKFNMVGRGQQDNGRIAFEPPTIDDLKEHWNMFKSYLSHLDVVLSELDALLKPIAIDNTVIVMVCNFGQSELLMNFVCQATRNGMNLSNIIVFTTDQETTDLATSLGLTAYYDQRVSGSMNTMLFVCVCVCHCMRICSCVM
jgi:hypothetical protein